jgi:hypothetical protein
MRGLGMNRMARRRLTKLQARQMMAERKKWRYADIHSTSSAGYKITGEPLGKIHFVGEDEYYAITGRT